MKYNIRFTFPMNVLSYVYCFTPYITHIYTKMMLKQCFSKKLYSVTPRVLQIYPPKTKSQPEISCA